MPKKAILVSFHPTTRLVVDIPASYASVEEFIDDNIPMLSRMAREKMLRDIGDYHYGDNLEAEEDLEMPAEENEKVDTDPEKTPSKI